MNRKIIEYLWDKNKIKKSADNGCTQKVRIMIKNTKNFSVINLLKASPSYYKT
jgi:hypothetical protein